MKKILTLFLTLILLAGCTDDRSKEKVTEILNSYQDNIKEIASKQEANSSETKKYSISFMETIYEFDYEIEEVIIKDDTAVAKVIIKTIDLAKFIDEFGKDTKVKETSEKLKSEKDILKQSVLVETLKQKIKEISSKYNKDYEIEIEIPLVKKDNDWELDPTYDIEKELNKAIMGSKIIWEE